MVACRPFSSNIEKILSYEVLSSTEWSTDCFKPNVFINIETTLEKKIKALQEYKSELREFPHPRSIEGVKILAKKRGMESNFKAAEGFILIREKR